MSIYRIRKKKPQSNHPWVIERTSDGRERATKPSHLCLVDEVGVML